MHEPTSPQSPDMAVRLTQLEQRLARLEEHAGLTTPPASPVAAAGPLPEAVAQRPQADDELEFEVGQVWFANIGIVVLAIGAGFALSQPFPGLPPWVPSAAGVGTAGALFLLSKLLGGSFALMAGYLRGAAMLLLFSSALRLYYFGAQPVLTTDTMAGRLVLPLVAAANLVIGFRRRSVWLTGTALLLGHLTLLAIGAPGFVLGGLPLLALVAVVLAVRADWPVLPIAAVLMAGATYLTWAVNNPPLTRAWKLLAEPASAPVALLAAMALIAAGVLWRKARAVETWADGAGALLNCAVGYGLLTMHALVIGGAGLLWLQLAAAVVLLGLAVAFWVRENSRMATFFYAMTGYLALSVAIMRSSALPEAFVWLSVQSLMVIATAIWFRSRFIVVANFAIYVAVVLGYMIAVRQETGISVFLGVVALASARIMNWKKDRLELKTELMRNSYLLAAFLIFPYALYHLVPTRHVALAWVGAALGYYGINLFIRSPKYRWMGHGTLLLTALYVVVVGVGRMSGAHRVLTFLVLGVVLVVVSLIFTRLRARRELVGGGEK